MYKSYGIYCLFALSAMAVIVQGDNQVQQSLQNIKQTLQQMQIEMTDLQNRYGNVKQTLNDVLLQEKQAVDEVKNNKCETPFNASSFLDNPRLLAVIPGGKYPSGIAGLDSQLFVVQGLSSQVNVYDTNSLTLIRTMTITGSSGLRGIAVSPRDNCLFISDSYVDVVYRYNLSNNVISKWSTGGICYLLSLTSTHNVLVTLPVTKQIKEYTPDGSLVRVIYPDSSLTYSWTSIQLPSGQLVVSDEGSLHRVCMLDVFGRIIKCYGGSPGSDVGHLNEPRDVAVDSNGNVFVADMGNDRIVLLSSALAYLGSIKVPGQALNAPWSLHLNALTRRLYIGEWSPAGRVFVLTGR